MIKSAAGGMVSVALECTGFESSIRTAIFVSHAKGRGAVLRARLGLGWDSKSLSAMAWTGESRRAGDDSVS